MTAKTRSKPASAPTPEPTEIERLEGELERIRAQKAELLTRRDEIADEIAKLPLLEGKARGAAIAKGQASWGGVKEFWETRGILEAELATIDADIESLDVLIRPIEDTIRERQGEVVLEQVEKVKDRQRELITKVNPLLEQLASLYPELVENEYRIADLRQDFAQIHQSDEKARNHVRPTFGFFPPTKAAFLKSVIDAATDPSYRTRLGGLVESHADGYGTTLVQIPGSIPDHAGAPSVL